MQHFSAYHSTLNPPVAAKFESALRYFFSPGGSWNDFSSLSLLFFRRYLTRKIGFEAVMRIRCTRGLVPHTFHGNFFVRSTGECARDGGGAGPGPRL